MERDEQRKDEPEEQSAPELPAPSDPLKLVLGDAPKSSSAERSEEAAAETAPDAPPAPAAGIPLGEPVLPDEPPATPGEDGPADESGDVPADAFAEEPAPETPTVPTLSMKPVAADADAPAAEPAADAPAGADDAVLEIGYPPEEQEEYEYVEVSTTGRLLGALAFIVAAATLAATALGYLPLGGIKDEQLPSGVIDSQKIAPGAVGMEQISLEARDQLAGPEGPRGARGPKGPKGDPGVGIGGITVVKKSVTADRNGHAEAEALCEQGKVIGGGAEILDASAREIVALTANSVLDERAGWRAAAQMLPAERGQRQNPAWRLEVRALCAKPDKPAAKGKQGGEQAASKAEGE